MLVWLQVDSWLLAAQADSFCQARYCKVCSLKANLSYFIWKLDVQVLTQSTSHPNSCLARLALCLKETLPSSRQSLSWEMCKNASSLASTNVFEILQEDSKSRVIWGKQGFLSHPARVLGVRHSCCFRGTRTRDTMSAGTDRIHAYNLVI